MSAIGEQAALLQHEWQTDPRWAGITRDYSALDVIRLRGRVAGEHSVARRAASRLWGLLHTQDTVRALGAATGNHAVQLARAGSQAIYLPGQAADGPPARTRSVPYPASPMTSVRRSATRCFARTRPPAEPGDGIVLTGGRWSRSWPTPAVRRMRSS